MERDLKLPSPSPKPVHRPSIPPRPSFRASAVAWLRKTHGWVGLWGATLGLLFGTSGIWLNHRAVLPLKVAQERSSLQLALPVPAPADAAAMATWLQSALRLDAPASSVRIEPARPLAWLERPDEGERRSNAPVAPAPAPLVQPERWAINFGGPRATVQAEYWAGNRSVSVRRTQSGLLGTLMNLHKGVGMSIGWILLVDTLAGSLILLSLSGIALWMLTRRRRLLGLAILATALAAVTGLAMAG
jgi:hypothetical protein